MSEHIVFHRCSNREPIYKIEAVHYHMTFSAPLVTHVRFACFMSLHCVRRNVFGSCGPSPGLLDCKKQRKGGSSTIADNSKILIVIGLSDILFMHV